ncbi:MAG: DEAD/DEAH box helicase [Patescibacteria group bacterium]
MSEDFNKFSTLGLSADLMTVIAGLKLTTPTPIQEKAIPPALTGTDLIGIAQTGTGKTFAFGVPILERLVKDNDSQAVILLPTRELAIQVEENIRKLNTIAHLPIAVLIGGENIDRQLYLIRRGLRIVVATPGRLADHLKRKSLKLDKTCILVLDEGDMMLDMGFLPQVEEIMAYLPKERQTMLFSATMPNGIVKLAAKHLKTPVRIEVAPAGTSAEQVDQEIYLVKAEDKLRHLEKVLAEYKGSVLVFMRTKYGAKGIVSKLKVLGFSAAEIHSNLSLNQRKDALAGFKSGKYRILVGTDIAARGLDVSGIELVVNYNLPDNLEDYVHRIGRTGRAGKSGKAISFAAITERRQIKEIEKLIKKNLPLKELTGMKFPERKLVVPVEREIGRADFSSRRDGARRFDSPRPGFGGASSARNFGEREPFKKKTFGDSRKPFGRGDKPFSRGEGYSRTRSSETANKLFSERSFSSNGERFGAKKPFSAPRKTDGRESSINNLFGFEKDLLPERSIKLASHRSMGGNISKNNSTRPPRKPQTKKRFK